MGVTIAPRFAGRPVLVTGAASGIGRATAQRFAAEGGRVLAVDTNEQGLAETAELVTRAGGTIDTRPCDITSKASVQAVVDHCAATSGHLDTLCNVAGVGGFYHFEEITEAEWHRVIGVNLTGAFLMTQAAIPLLLRGTRASVVSVASVAGMRGTAYAAPYAASKAGLINMSRSLALEFATRKLRFNCVCPGGVRTPLLASSFALREDFEMHLLAYNQPPSPGTFAEPEEIADVITFLASDAAQRINGASVTCDGGALA